MKSILLAILAFPLIWPWIAKRIWPHTITWKEMGVNIGAAVIPTIAIFYIGSLGATADVEIRNGEVLSKHRDHGSYVRTYQCNCTTHRRSDGTTYQTCQTCYEHHYTVEWYLRCNIGNFQIKYLDRTSRSVYSTSNPEAYDRAYVGEPCSMEFAYTNYIRAVPESVFNFEEGSTLEIFKDIIPEYPKVRYYNNVNRVLKAGTVNANLQAWNTRLADKLKVVGPKKEANIIIILANTPDQTFRHAIEEAWLGGKKNDIIILIGVPDFPKVAWADVITLGHNEGNSLFTVEMRDAIVSMNEVGIGVVDVVAAEVLKRFDRKSMEDYAYLKDEILPPAWLIIFAAIIGTGSSIGWTYFMHKNDLFGDERRRRF